MSLKQVYFGKNITQVNDNASNMFLNCDTLEKIYHFPQNTKRADSCFSGCKNLSYIENIPSQLEWANHMFCGCTNLRQEFEMPQNLYDMCGMFQNSGVVGVYNIPQNKPTNDFSNVIMRDNAFYDAKNLKNVSFSSKNIPSNEYNVSTQSMFCNAVNLKNIVGEIKTDNASNMFKNTSIDNIPTLKSENSVCCNNCFSGTKIKKIDGIPFTLGDTCNMFSNCEDLVEVKNISIIGNSDHMFSYCEDLVEVKNISIIGNSDHMFSYCSNLFFANNIKFSPQQINSDTTYIVNNIFFNNPKLQDISLDAYNTTVVLNNCFSNCYNLYNINLNGNIDMYNSIYNFGNSKTVVEITNNYINKFTHFYIMQEAYENNNSTQFFYNYGGFNISHYTIDNSNASNGYVKIKNINSYNAIINNVLTIPMYYRNNIRDVSTTNKISIANYADMGNNISLGNIDLDIGIPMNKIGEHSIFKNVNNMNFYYKEKDSVTNMRVFNNTSSINNINIFSNNIIDINITYRQSGYNNTSNIHVSNGYIGNLSISGGAYNLINIGPFNEEDEDNIYTLNLDTSNHSLSIGKLKNYNINRHYNIIRINEVSGYSTLHNISWNIGTLNLSISNNSNKPSYIYLGFNSRIDNIISGEITLWSSGNYYIGDISSTNINNINIKDRYSELTNITIFVPNNNVKNNVYNVLSDYLKNSVNFNVDSSVFNSNQGGV